MLTAYTACFVLGVWWVQNSSELPSNLLMVAMGIYILICSLFVFQINSRTSKLALQSIAFLLFGVLWSAVMALWRLSDELLREWQQQEIEVVGVVSSLPHNGESKSNFRFDVEKVMTKSAVVPRHISLNVYHYCPNVSTKPDFSIPDFKPGQRWQFSVKLKMPHSSLNPHGFDFSQWAIAQNIRAFGYVRTQHDMHLLNEFVWKPAYMFDRLRDNVRSYLTDALKDSPHRGVIAALVIGDEKDINPATWELMLRTGITLLMSISGLHITMVSGLFYFVIYQVWRRVNKLSLMMPARKAAEQSDAGKRIIVPYLRSDGVK